jgi:hypothetical protein
MVSRLSLFMRLTQTLLSPRLMWTLKVLVLAQTQLPPPYHKFFSDLHIPLNHQHYRIFLFMDSYRYSWNSIHVTILTNQYFLSIVSFAYSFGEINDGNET